MTLRIQHALTELVPTIPQTHQTELTWPRNQCEHTHTDTQADTSILYVEIT